MNENNKKHPLVSVCIPTYNRSKKLLRAIKKLEEQTYKNLEIIISDNCSSDDTEDICKVLENENKQIKYFRQEKNYGPTVNFEFVKKQVNGKYFLWHGDDDYLDNNYIELCVQELEKDEKLVLVSGLAAYKKFGEGQTTHYGNIIQPNSNFLLIRVIKYLWNVQENSIFCGAYRTKNVQSCYMPNLLAGDWIWMVQVLILGKANVLPSINVIRSFGDSTSVSYESIVKSINAPLWQAKFPNIAISLNVFKFFRKNNFLVAIVGFLTLMLRTILNKFKIYLGLSKLKRIYIGIFKK